MMDVGGTVSNPVCLDHWIPFFISTHHDWIGMASRHRGVARVEASRRRRCRDGAFLRKTAGSYILHRRRDGYPDGIPVWKPIGPGIPNSSATSSAHRWPLKGSSRFSSRADFSAFTCSVASAWPRNGISWPSSWWLSGRPFQPSGSWPQIPGCKPPPVTSSATAARK